MEQYQQQRLGRRSHMFDAQQYFHTTSRFYEHVVARAERGTFVGACFRYDSDVAARFLGTMGRSRQISPARYVARLEQLQHIVCQRDGPT